MIATIFYEFCFIIIVNWNYDLFPRVILCGHIDSWFGFAVVFDNLLNVINFVCFEIREGFLDFKDFLGSVSRLWHLSIQFTFVVCCSNHSSLKDKWSHNEQSSPMGYQVKSVELQENSTRSPRCISPLFI